MNRDTGRFAVILSLMALAALFGRQPAKAQSPTYSFINLGTLDTGVSSQAYGINIFDEVVGVSTIAPANSSGVVISHAFFWSPGNGMLDLFPADTTLNSEAHGINLFGQFAGFHQIADGSTHAFIGDIFNGIETDPYTNNNWAYSINDEAQAAGQTLYSDGTEEESWYELFDGGIFGLGNGGNQNATAYGIADLTPTESFGDTAGVMYPGGGFTPHAYYNVDFGNPTDISSDGFNFFAPAGAFALNNDGYATGYATSYPRGVPNQIGVIFDGFLGVPVQSLGTLPGQDWSIGRSINSSLEVVGQSGPYAFLWTPWSGIVNINSLIPPRTGWVILNAMAINDFGDIVGQAVHRNGVSHAVLLLPTVLQSFTLSPNPVTGGQNLLGSLTLSAPAPYNLKIVLKSNNPAVISKLKNVIIPAGQTGGTFQISTLSVTNTTFVNLTASFGGVTLPQTLQVTP